MTLSPKRTAPKIYARARSSLAKLTCAVFEAGYSKPARNEKEKHQNQQQLVLSGKEDKV